MSVNKTDLDDWTYLSRYCHVNRLQQQELDSFFYTHISLQIHHKTTITDNNSNRVALTNMFIVWMSHVNKTH